VYHHPQPFWFYLPVFLLAEMPWLVWLVAAVIERVRHMSREGREALASPEDAWALFLLIWMIVPVLFFSASQSKLPGYILPAVPAGALLVTEYLAACREEEVSVRWPLAAVHGVTCGAIVFGALSAGSIAIHHHLVLTRWTYVAIAVGVVVALGIMIAVTKGGARLVRSATMIAVILSVAAVIRFAAPAIDATQSARPVAQIIQAFSREPVPIALYHVTRVEQYGLEFYLNRQAQKYDDGDVPADAHLLVAGVGTDADLHVRLGGRKVSYLTSIPAQKLELYWVGAR
jgi:4-amino-4-deoxy-L-arabinose transferase-like glycosyltransferase